MSVAFRRESDEEHLEPKFELPIPPGPNLVTPQGLALLHERAAQLTEVIAGGDDVAREVAAREKRYVDTRIATAEPAPAPPAGEIGIGSVATIRLAGRTRRVAIVGHDEADPAADRLAFSAPLARALIGAVAGERVDFAGRAEAIEILDVADPEPDR